MRVNVNVVKPVLLAVAIVLVLSGANAFVDVNINRPGMTDGNYISNNIAGGKVFIDFNYFDSNSAQSHFPDRNGYTLDFNLYYSSTAGAFQNRIVSDKNLMLLTDANRISGGTDSNRYRWVWDTSVQTPADGNYFIDINVFNNTFKALGTLTAVDRNSSGISIIVDNTAPTVSISSSATSNTTTYSLTYSGSDANAGIKKYWVSSDNSVWTDNGTAISYNFTAPAHPYTSTFYVKSQDFADNNSSVASITVTPQGTGGGTTPVCGDNSCNGNETSASCPSDCSAICGDGACTRAESTATCPADCGPAIVCGNGVCDLGETPGTCREDCVPQGQVIKEIILSRTKEGKPTPQQITDILTAAGASETAIQKASGAAGKTNFKRKVEVVKEKATDGKESFVSNITVSVSNTSGERLKSIKIVEMVPKNVASNASQISSTKSFRVLQQDPIIEFTVDSIEAGQTAELTYEVKKQLTDTQINGFSPPVLFSVLESAPSCDNIRCNDNNACTSDSCFDGVCSYTPVADQTSCGFGKVCRSGNCISVQQSVPQNQANPPATDFTVPIIIIIVIVVVAGFYYYNKQK